MAITCITKDQKRQRFLVYDLEWIPGTLELRLVGVYDGKEYRHYFTIEDFLDGEMNHETAGAWFYAHAGGLADVQFVLETIIGQGTYSVHASFSGSSAIIVNVRKDGKVWRFVDSYWLLRDSLSNIAKSLGMAKGDTVPGFDKFNEQEKKDFFSSIPILQLRDYNEQDCKILYTAICNFEDTIYGWGGILKKTQASTALELFRRKFLRFDIDTFDSLSECSRNAYFASRVEVFTADCEGANYYDINSSFPASMMQPCPGNYLGTSRNLPDDGYPYIADLLFEIQDTYLPPIPARVKGRVFFPTGRWRSWLSSVDVELLLEQGNRIIKVYEVHKFDKFNDLADYVKTIYDHRKASSDPFVRQVDKILLNSLYGKFGESPDKTAMHYNPSEKMLMKWEKSECEVEQLFPGCWLEHRVEPVQHAHVAISVHITALSRKAIFDYMNNCKDVHYCDTDGFSTSEELGVTGDEIGMLKLERRIGVGQFVAPKVYRLDDKVKAKGFSLSKDKQTAIEQFESLVQSGRISVTRMTRLRELYRGQSLKPKESLVVKGLTGVTSGKSVHKRHMYPDGESRPWHIDELHEMLDSKTTPRLKVKLKFSRPKIREGCEVEK